MNRVIGLMILLLAAGLLSGCDLQAKTETVDEAVSLLQDIKDSGTWTTIEDGLDALDDQGESYALTARFQAGQTESTLAISVDEDANATIEITDNGQTRAYFVENYRSSAENTAIYEITAGRYACAAADAAAPLLRHGPASLFETYAINAVGVQTLSIVEKDKDSESTIAGRDVYRYDLVSRVPDALKILDRLDNAELRAQIDAAGPFELTGALYLDQDTLALLRFDSVYRAANDQSEFSFEITQWGAIPDIPVPAANAIETACP